MEAFSLEAGLSRQLFGLPATILPCMSLPWFMQTWQSCKVLDIDITTDIIDFEPTRYQDKELMRNFLQFGVTGQDLASLNCCCMYVYAIHLLTYVTEVGQQLIVGSGKDNTSVLLSTTGLLQQNQLWGNGKLGGRC